MTLYTTHEDGLTTIYLEGHIDSANAYHIEASINEALSKNPPKKLIVDLKKLQYISSAGLRIMLKLKKRIGDVSLINASTEVYEIFDTTGFVEIMDVSKAMREIDITGCEMIGEGANGRVYRIARDTIVKTYKSASIEDIRRERELSRTAFVLGIPTAIPYDVVKVGDCYGSVFELLNAKSFDELMRESDKNLEFVAYHSSDIAHIIHDTPAPATVPDTDDQIFEWLDELEGYLTDAEREKIAAMIKALPKNGTLIHGDLHIKNIMQQNEETLLIDMDTLATGHPIYELAFMYNAYKGYGIADKSMVENFFGLSVELTHSLWRRILELYLDTTDNARIEEVEEKAALIGLLRVMRRPINKGFADTQKGQELIKACGEEIRRLLNKIDDLDF